MSSSVTTATPTATAAELVADTATPARETWRHFRSNPLGVAAVAVIVLMTVVAVAASMMNAPCRTGKSSWLTES